MKTRSRTRLREDTLFFIYLDKTVRASIRPTHTAARQQTNESSVFRKALSQSPSRMRSSVCRLTDENVVYPPQTPIKKNCRNRGGARNGPSESVKAAKNPIRKEPVTFTTNVPMGKNSPTRPATIPDVQNRAPVPSAPPSITTM